MGSRRNLVVAVTAGLSLVAAGCGGDPGAGDPTQAREQGPLPEDAGGDAGSGEGLSGELVGAGATFPDPLYQEWIGEFTSAVEPGVSINYQAIGSGGGVEQFIGQSTDFGASDASLTDDELADATAARGCDPLHIPTVFGAVAPAFNVEGLDDLVLDGPTLADIFLGNITNFNDPAIAELNPDTELPDQEITVVHRSDGSGTTSIFTTYLDDVSPEWSEQVGAGKEVQWPTGVGGNGNDGVAAGIQQNPGALGYVELSFALENDIATVTMVNADGNEVEPSLESTAAAADGIDIPDDLRFDILDVGGQGFPIAGATWILAWECGYDESTAGNLKAFLTWALEAGDATAEELLYAPLGDSLREQSLANVEAINADG
ncbi:MAG: phosphate ABC transporter substrate-binding protein PstS [Egibacteraceae bacterium]